MCMGTWCPRKERGYWVPWIWNFWQLGAAMRVFRIKSKFAARASTLVTEQPLQSIPLHSYFESHFRECDFIIFGPIG